MIAVEAETSLAFGDGPFEDAWALLWVQDLLDGGWEAVRIALAPTRETDRALADDVETWAACEVVAALRSPGPHLLPNDVAEWLSNNDTPADLSPLAIQALIRLARTSMLKDAMRSRHRIRTWLLGLHAIARRLGGAVPRNLLPSEDVTS